MTSDFKGAPKTIKKLSQDKPEVNRTTTLFRPPTVHDDGSKISVPKEVTDFIKSYRKRTAAEVRCERRHTFYQKNSRGNNIKSTRQKNRRGLPSRQLIAKECQIDRKKVDAAIAALSDMGVI